jgi:predicted DNA-binding protein (UPF0251 family)
MKQVESNMAEQSKVVVIPGRKTKTAAVAISMQASGEVREATTGSVLTLPRVWAVAAPAQEVKPTRVKAERSLPAPELSFYRKYTERLLQRYVQMTMEAGRVSSMMGREVLGGKASSYRVHGFDDAVIFRLDVEKCLKRLDTSERAVIKRIAIQEYTHQEAADLLQVSLRTVGTRYAKAMDRLTGILLETRMLEPQKACQGGIR